MLINLKDLNPFFDTANKLASDTFYNELQLAAILFGSKNVFITFYDDEKVYNTFSIVKYNIETITIVQKSNLDKPFYYTEDTKTLNLLNILYAEKTAFKCFASVPIYITEELKIGAIYVMGYKPLNSSKLDALMLLSNASSKIIANKINNKDRDLLNGLVIRKSIHDIKNPLASISLQTELIKKLVLSPDKIEGIADKILGNIQRIMIKMNKIIDDQKF